MTNDELRQEFDAWAVEHNMFGDFPCADNDFQDVYEADLARTAFYAGYMACNAKRQEEMARDKALLRECAHMLLWAIKTGRAAGWTDVLLGNLKQAGYGNE
jgi:hypothetical protein